MDSENLFTFSLSDFMIILVYAAFLFKYSKKGISYIFLVNIVLFINLIGNLSLEKDLFVTTNINFVLFILLHNLFFRLFSNNRIVINRQEPSFGYLYFSNHKIVKVFFYVCILLSLFFFFQVGVVVLKDNLHNARHALNYGSGVFFRIIIHVIPVLAAILIGDYFNKYNNKKNFIFPLVSIVIIFLTGFRGFLVWTAVYYVMVANNYKRIKVNNIWVILSIIAIISILVYITLQYYDYLHFEGAVYVFFDRLFIGNVYGYNILINDYIPNNAVNIFNAKALPTTLFSWKFSGENASSGAELTITLPGMTYALGGYILTFLGSIIIGAIAGVLVKSNKKTNNTTLIALRTFILYSFMALISRGNLITYFGMVLLSIIILSIILVLSSQKRFIKWDWMSKS